MPTIDGKLGPKETPMSPEDWEVNKDCTAKKRDHKWQWEYNGEGQTSATNAVCVHCGKRTMLTHKGQV